MSMRRRYGMWLAHLAAMGLLSGVRKRGPWISVGPEPHKYTPEEVERIKAEIVAKRARRKR